MVNTGMQTITVSVQILDTGGSAKTTASSSCQAA